MASPITRHLSERSKVASIIVMVLALAITTWLTHVHLVVLYNILHHLNILPLMLAGMLFGWRGAMKALLLATILQSPSIYRNWHTMPLDAQDQIVELSTFGAAGVIAGIVADRARMQRRRVETTIAVTCDGRELEQTTSRVLMMPVLEESTVMTAWFTSMLLALQYLAACTANDEAFLLALRTLPSHLSRLLAEYSPQVESFARHDVDDFVFLGQGPSMPSPPSPPSR